MALEIFIPLGWISFEALPSRLLRVGRGTLDRGRALKVLLLPWGATAPPLPRFPPQSLK